jgi:hypothetical protein
MPTDVEAWYNLACASALAGRKRKALDSLGKALELDRNGRLKRSAKADPDLESLRDDPEFRKLTSE